MQVADWTCAATSSTQQHRAAHSGCTAHHSSSRRCLTVEAGVAFVEVCSAGSPTHIDTTLATLILAKMTMALAMVLFRCRLIDTAILSASATIALLNQWAHQPVVIVGYTAAVLHSVDHEHSISVLHTCCSNRLHSILTNTVSATSRKVAFMGYS